MVFKLFAFRESVILRKERFKVYLEDDAVELEAGPFAVDVSRQSPDVNVSMLKQRGDFLEHYAPHFSSSLYSL